MARIARLPHPKKLALDFLFFLWLGYVAVTGQVLPDQAVALFRDDPPAVVITEPDAIPGLIEPDAMDPQRPEA